MGRSFQPPLGTDIAGVRRRQGAMVTPEMHKFAIMLQTRSADEPTIHAKDPRRRVVCRGSITTQSTKICPRCRRS